MIGQVVGSMLIKQALYGFHSTYTEQSFFDTSGLTEGGLSSTHQHSVSPDVSKHGCFPYPLNRMRMGPAYRPCIL
ncbi:unnamed protein product [Penicillium roqueforti FM164]|uniref:Genomic scaffold, ProqFM164S03 n=1 Tax=Penicillium roqueforti (strain FM164) TaxID=1365484 RepID=W6QJI9_PENRF|nr:unnamed protein product [Penicillium roqueforti FM164]